MFERLCHGERNDMLYVTVTLIGMVRLPYVTYDGVYCDERGGNLGV